MNTAIFAGVLCVCALMTRAFAQNSWTWRSNKTGTQAWATNSNWSFDGKGGGSTVPQNTGDIANLQVRIQADTVITGPAGQVGELRLGDSGGNHSFTIARGDLTFSSNAGTPLLLKSGAATDFITAAVNFNNGLETRVSDGSRLDISGNIQGNSLVKSGGGTLRLTGDYGNAGGTFNVTGGTLVIDSLTVQNSNLAAVVVQNGATLAGVGKVVGATTFSSGAIHAAGNGPENPSNTGVQTFTKAVTYQSGSIFSWNLSDAVTSGRGDAYDGVTAQGGLHVENGAIFRIVTDLDFSNSFWDEQKSWTDVFAVTGSNQGWADQTLATVFDGSGIPRDLSSEGSFHVSGTHITWNPSAAAPEPAGAVAGLLLAAGLLRRRR